MLTKDDRRCGFCGVRAVTLIYALSHFCVDFACAYFVLRFVRKELNWYHALLLYNFCAFALQLPIALFLDRLGNGKLFSATGCLAVAISLAFQSKPIALCIMAGIGNALFHIGGGHDVIRLSEDKAGWLGVFVSPGALGLFLGGWMGSRSFQVWPVFAILLVIAILILILCPPVSSANVDAIVNQSRQPWLAGLILLFLVICLRSYVGFLFKFPWKVGIWTWLFTLSVVCGKTVGGWLYDRMGGSLASAVSLGFAAALFLVSDNAIWGCLAVLLFNVTMPITLRAMADEIPGNPALSFGLTTLALFLGYLPIWLRWPVLSGKVFFIGACLVSLAMLLPAMLRRCKCSGSNP